jgi:hypothetical protein
MELPTEGFPAHYFRMKKEVPVRAGWGGGGAPHLPRHQGGGVTPF